MLKYRAGWEGCLLLPCFSEWDRRRWGSQRVCAKYVCKGYELWRCFCFMSHAKCQSLFQIQGVSQQLFGGMFFIVDTKMLLCYTHTRTLHLHKSVEKTESES